MAEARRLSGLLILLLFAVLLANCQAGAHSSLRGTESAPMEPPPPPPPAMEASSDYALQENLEANSFGASSDKAAGEESVTSRVGAEGRGTPHRANADSTGVPVRPLAEAGFRLAQSSPVPQKPAAHQPSPTHGEPVPRDNAATASDAPRASGPLLIYEATLTMSAYDTLKALDQIHKLATDAGGYLVIRGDQSITVRVPAERFDDLLKQVLIIGDVIHRNVSVKDVTGEYYDIQIRLRNAEAVLERLTQLLRRADKVEDALSVERELQRVAAEVEVMKGRLKLLRELVSFSTVTVTFQRRPVESVDKTVRLPFPWLETLGLGNLLSL